MNRPEDDELIQGEIDGVNQAAESALLKELLASRPELDSRLGSLRFVAETLDRAERFDPPPGLVDDVMSQVRRRKLATAARPGWREALQALFAPAPLAACAFTLIVGFVLGGLLPSDSGLFSHSERAALSGTALSRGQLGASGVIGRQLIAVEGITGEAVTSIEGGRLVVRLELDATRPCDVSLDLDGTGLSPLSFSQDGPSGRDVVMAEDLVRFSHPAGRRQYDVTFAVGPEVGQALRLRVGDGEGWNLSLKREGPR